LYDSRIIIALETYWASIIGTAFFVAKWRNVPSWIFWVACCRNIKLCNWKESYYCDTRSFEELEYEEFLGTFTEDEKSLLKGRDN
jgi:hypothetical protein